jgi:hypothetical protein
MDLLPGNRTNSALFCSHRSWLVTVLYLTHGSNCLLPKSKSKSKLLCNWRFITNQFILAPSPLGPTTNNFFQLNPCSNSPYVTSSLTRRWVHLLWICLAFVKCIFCTYSMLLGTLPFALHTSPLSVQALQSRSCLSYISYATKQLSHLNGCKLAHRQV